MTVQILECTQQAPKSYITNVGAINVLMYDNWDKNYRNQQLQEDS